jgi:hypothetical protein
MKEGMLSQASSNARTAYYSTKNATNVRNYFNTVIFDISATNMEKATAAEAYKNTDTSIRRWRRIWHPAVRVHKKWWWGGGGWVWKSGWHQWIQETDNKEHIYANAAYRYFVNPTKETAGEYMRKAFDVNIQSEYKFKAVLAYFNLVPDYYENGHINYEKNHEKNAALYSLQQYYYSSTNATLKMVMWDEYYIAVHTYSQVRYDKAEKELYNNLETRTPQKKYEIAKEYYEATVAYISRDKKEKSKEDKSSAAKAYYEATVAYDSSTPEQKYLAAKSFHNTSRHYGDDSQKYDAAKAYYESTLSYEPTKPDEKEKFATEKFLSAEAYYNAAQSGTIVQKYLAAKAYYEATSKYNFSDAQKDYDAAKTYYDLSTAEGSNATDADKNESTTAYYNTAILLDSSETSMAIKYNAAKTRLDYMNKNINYKDDEILSDVAKKLYENSNTNIPNQKFDSSEKWFDYADNSSKNESAKNYYMESTKLESTNPQSCKKKCLAAKAYFDNGGSKDTNTSFERNFYIQLMGDNCENTKDTCNIIKKEGFQNREPITQCQQSSQKTIFKSAESALLSYHTTPNQKYSELDTMNAYFSYATKENGLNTNDIMNAAKRRVDFMRSMKTIDYNELRLAALDYYKASMELDCGDIAYNRYFAIKTYYEIAKDSPNSDIATISKNYYTHTVDAERENSEKYAVAKIWFANSPSIDSARAVYKSAVLLHSGAKEIDKYNAVIKYKELGGTILPEEEQLILAIHNAALSVRTDQTQTIQHDTAKSAYNIMKAYQTEGFTMVGDFKKGPETCICSSSINYDSVCAAYCAYSKAETPQQKLIDAQDWSGINYQTDIVDRRKELDTELSKLNENAEVKIHKLDLDTTIMMNIAATVLASSIIVFSITKL